MSISIYFRSLSWDVKACFAYPDPPDPAEAIRIAHEAKRVAVVGINPKPDRPANFVPATLQRLGVTIVPVPTMFPELQELLGEKVYRKASQPSGGSASACFVAATGPVGDPAAAGGLVGYPPASRTALYLSRATPAGPGHSRGD